MLSSGSACWLGPLSGQVPLVKDSFTPAVAETAASDVSAAGGGSSREHSHLVEGKGCGPRMRVDGDGPGQCDPGADMKADPSGDSPPDTEVRLLALKNHFPVAMRLLSLTMEDCQVICPARSLLRFARLWLMELGWWLS